MNYMIHTPDIELVEAVFELAPDFYDATYPYHNFEGHIQKTVAGFIEIQEWLDDRGIPINREHGIIASLQHDYNFHLDQQSFGFKKKEELSAFESRKQLRELGASPHTIRTASGIILATAVDVEPVTNLEKAVRIADVGNVANNPSDFLHNTYLNILEMVVRGLPLPDTFEEFRKGTRQFLGLYYNKPLVFKYRGHEVPFDPMNGIAQENLGMLGSLGLKKFIETVGAQVADIEEKLPSNWFARKIF